MADASLKIRYQHVYITRHFRDTPKPRVTFCYIESLSEPVTYVGVSICCDLDNPDKSDGRRRAYDRAMEAREHKTTTGLIAHSLAIEIMDAISPQLVAIPTYKSIMVPVKGFRFFFAM